MANISDRQLMCFQRLMLQEAGVTLPPNKKALLWGRLAKRLASRGLSTLDEYYRLITDGGDAAELQRAIDLLTTHETYFFREPRHFELLADTILPALAARRPLHLWSAASSSGEEAYSLAMVLMDRLGPAYPWEVLATDISTEVLDRGRAGIYPMQRIDGIPPGYLRRYCLRGVDRYAGTLLIVRALRERVKFSRVNLADSLPGLGEFDVIFVRNVLIYFDQDTKQAVIARLLERLRPGGWLITGHSEALGKPAAGLQMIEPTVYRRTA